MSDRPNILFLFSDQQRADWTEMNPRIPVRTPHLRALANRGVRFTNAICPSPLCAPSRACLAAGLSYDRIGVQDNGMLFPAGQATYHRRLRDEAGYHVMGAGKFHIGCNITAAEEFCGGLNGRELPRDWGFSAGLFNASKNQCVIKAERLGRPWDPYMSYLREQGWMETHIEDYRRRTWEWEANPDFWTATFPTQLPNEVYFDNWITRNGLSLLDRAPTDKPWYLEVDFQNPHHPWDITEEMCRMYRNPEVEFPSPVDGDPEIPEDTLLAGDAVLQREVSLAGLGSWRLAYDGRYKLIVGYDPELRRGGFQVEPMAVTPEEAARMQRERPPILYDVQENERDNLAADYPQIVERLGTRLMAQQTPLP